VLRACLTQAEKRTRLTTVQSSRFGGVFEEQCEFSGPLVGPEELAAQSHRYKFAEVFWDQPSFSEHGLHSIMDDSGLLNALTRWVGLDAVRARANPPNSKCGKGKTKGKVSMPLGSIVPGRGPPACQGEGKTTIALDRLSETCKTLRLQVRKVWWRCISVEISSRAWRGHAQGNLPGRMGPKWSLARSPEFLEICGEADVCEHWLDWKCSYGDDCRHIHCLDETREAVQAQILHLCDQIQSKSNGARATGNAIPSDKEMRRALYHCVGYLGQVRHPTDDFEAVHCILQRFAAETCTELLQ